MSDFIYTPLDNLIDDCTGKTRIERDKLLADRAHLIAALKEAKNLIESVLEGVHNPDLGKVSEFLEERDRKCERALANINQALEEK